MCRSCELLGRLRGLGRRIDLGLQFPLPPTDIDPLFHFVSYAFELPAGRKPSF